MQTSPVASQANVQSSAAPARNSGADAPATPFDQVLSREMTDRSDSAQQAQGTQQSASQPAAGTDAANKAKAAKSGDAKKDDDGKTADAKKDDKATDTAATTPADMLALVANLNQGRQDAKGKTTPGTDAAVALTADGKKAMPAATALAGAAAADGKGKKAGAALDPAAADSEHTDPKTAPDTAKAEAAKAAGELSAKEQQLVDTTAASEKSDFDAALKDSLANAPAPAPQAAHQAMQPLAQAAAAAAGGEKLTPPVGTPAWDQALGQKVAWMVNGQQQSASLTLNPPDLGPLQVVLSVHNSTAHASFTAAQPEVRQALEAAMPKLRDMLSDAGIQLGQANVSSGSSNQQAPDRDRHSAPTSRNTERLDGVSGDAPVRVGRVLPAASGSGLVDTFV